MTYRNNRSSHPGTRVFSPPVGVKAEVATGLASGSLRGEQAPDWVAGGARCLDADPELFHPLGHSAAEQAQARQTIHCYCQDCPMVATCYAWGVKVGRKKGIWGAAWLDGPKDMRTRSGS